MVLRGELLVDFSNLKGKKIVAMFGWEIEIGPYFNNTLAIQLPKAFSFFHEAKQNKIQTLEETLEVVFFSVDAPN